MKKNIVIKTLIVGILLGGLFSAVAADKPNVRFIAIDKTKSANKQPGKPAEKIEQKPLTGKPNIVFIFIDDMGYGDIGPFGSTINKTPELDRMAEEGMRLTQYYVSSTACTPSRSALMTGCYADRVGMDGRVVFPGDERGLNPAEITIAELLKTQGYATGCFGKWHLGDQPEFMPLAQGFDEYTGIPYSNDMWPFLKSVKCPPLPLVKGNKVVAHISDGPSQSLLCKVVTDGAVDFIKKHREEPFFLYVPHAYIHGPRFARKELLEKAEGNVTRAQIEEVDWSVGQILKTLREQGLAQNTLVIFTSDNGGSGGTSMGPLRGNKGGPKYEGHMRVPTVAWWPGQILAGSETDEIAATIDMLPTFAALTGAKLPADRIIDGHDISSLLLEPGAKSPREILYYEYGGIRRGPWKLVRLGKKTELYNLDDDLGEKNNLTEKYPGIAEELNALLDQHMATVQANKRPAAFVENPKPLLESTDGVPALTEYLGLPDLTVEEWAKPVKKNPKTGKKKIQSNTPRKSTDADFADADSGDILIADFEGDTYGEWKVEGDAFGSRPARANENPPPNKVVGHQGNGLVNSYFGKDQSTGTLTSPEFTIERKHINFLIGAGNHVGKTCMNLLVGGKVVRTAVGPARKNKGQEVLEWTSWLVAELVGQKATLLVDNHTKGWGHINIDHIVQSDKEVKGAAKQKKPEFVDANLVELSATFKVDNTHLIVPVANHLKKSPGNFIVLGIYDGERLVQNISISLPRAGDAYWLASYPLEYFGLDGKQITIKPLDDKKVADAYRNAFNLIRCGDDFPDQLDSDYAKPYRNQFHASTRRGWNNDGNGMVYHDGKYHLYYQYNPFGIFWGNMHWGHFKSEDLINWRETPIALYQKTVKDMMFSGGGFVDFNNSAGLGENTQFAAFTSTGRGECLAYSKDGGLTFTELPENPVVEHKGRDPKIIWYEPEKKWVMAVYDTSECAETEATPSEAGKRSFANIAFYESKNLRQWNRTGAFTDLDRSAVFECPEFFELPIEGGNGETRWVVYGAQNRYFVGHFDGKTFTKESCPHGSQHGSFYAAQTFSDVPDGRRIQIGWVRTASYEKIFPDQLVNQAFTLPHEMTLRKTPDGLRVFFSPVKETEALRGEVLAEGKDLSVSQAQAMLQARRGELSEVVIEFAQTGKHEVVINGIDAWFEGRSARIFTDSTFNEVYADDGVYYEVRTRPASNFDSTETMLNTDQNGRVKSLKVYRLKSIWPQPSRAAASTERPNVIVVLTDDQGYGDVSAHGNPLLKTPEMDKLRAQSVRFTDFHVAPMCTPTRGQLMTGMDAMRNGATAVCQGRSMIRNDLKLMPQFFAEAGYATGLFGKWHLGDSYPHRPRFRGFEEVVSFRAWGITSLADYWGNGYFDPVLMHNGVDKKYEGYCTDIYFDEAMKWIDQCQSKKKPFFLYLPTNTPHVPEVVAENYSAPYKGKYEGKPIPGNFYGMIANIDENIGKLEAFLKTKGLRDNTILIFMSDNGTQNKNAMEIFNAGMRDKKTSVYEGGHRVPMFIRWIDGKLQHGTDISELTQVQDLLPTLADFCGLNTDGATFDGTSLAGLLTGEQNKLAGRMCVVQYKGEGEMWEPAVMMWDTWRLVMGKTLYNIAQDPGQQKDVYSEFPEVAKKMTTHYDTWYKEAKPLYDKERYIIVGSSQANSVILYASDWQGSYCDNRGGLTKATGTGYWDLIVDRNGTYEIELRRWSEESGKTLVESFDGTSQRGARPVAKAQLLINGIDQTIDTQPKDKVAKFTVKLKAGKTKLTANLLDKNGQMLCGAMYVKVTKK